MLRQLAEMTVPGERFSPQMRKAFLDIGPRPFGQQDVIDEVRLQEEPDTDCFRLMLDVMCFEAGTRVDPVSEELPIDYEDVSIATLRFDQEDKSKGEKLVEAMNHPDMLKRANLTLEKMLEVKQRATKLAVMTGVISITNLIFAEKVL